MKKLSTTWRHQKPFSVNQPDTSKNVQLHQASSCRRLGRFPITSSSVVTIKTAVNDVAKTATTTPCKTDEDNAGNSLSSSLLSFSDSIDADLVHALETETTTLIGRYNTQTEPNIILPSKSEKTKKIVNKENHILEPALDCVSIKLSGKRKHTKAPIGHAVAIDSNLDGNKQSIICALRSTKSSNTSPESSPIDKRQRCSVTARVKCSSSNNSTVKSQVSRHSVPSAITSELCENVAAVETATVDANGVCSLENNCSTNNSLNLSDFSFSPLSLSGNADMFDSDDETSSFKQADKRESLNNDNYSGNKSDATLHQKQLVAHYCKNVTHLKVGQNCTEECSDSSDRHRNIKTVGDLSESRKKQSCQNQFRSSNVSTTRNLRSQVARQAKSITSSPVYQTVKHNGNISKMCNQLIPRACENIRGSKCNKNTINKSGNQNNQQENIQLANHSKHCLPNHDDSSVQTDEGVTPEVNTISNDQKHTSLTPGTGNLLQEVSVGNCSLTVDKRQLSSWDLPEPVLEAYRNQGVLTMFEWQAECLLTGNVLGGGNLVYSAPTSAGKTLVAELLILKRVLESRKKALFILPFVSVVREKVYSLQRLYQDAGVRVGGFMGSHSPPGGFSHIHVAVCTIEKGNSLINRLMEEGKLSELGVVVIDELHMVGDSHRGYLLELMLTKLAYVTQRAKDRSADHHVQIIGMSATLPNLPLLAKWLDASLYCTNFRPVPLHEYIKIDRNILNEHLVIQREIPAHLVSLDDVDQVIALCLETVINGHGVLVFCPTKNWCEKLCEAVARKLYTLVLHSQDVTTDEATNLTSFGLKIHLDKSNLMDTIEQLRRSPVGLDPMLGKCILNGVAYHHAGLTFDERDIIEGAFRQGHVRILVATSTLSSGVNLPARRVIIRSPMFYGKIIDTLTYKQMVGRAGRKGIDTEGESILVCKPQEKNVAKKLVESDLPPVKSCLHFDTDVGLTGSLKRAILEVVVSGVAPTPQDVITYISCTLLSASLSEDSQNNMKTALVDSCIKFLKDNEFVSVNISQNEDGTTATKFYPTQLGSAILASSLSPDEGLLVFAELQKARRAFVLDTELHIIYLVTPVYTSDVSASIDWYHYHHLWESLTPADRRVADLVGISESFIARAIQGRINGRTEAQRKSLAVHQRFYTALILYCLVQETPLMDVAAKFHCNKGQLQSLQQAASTYAGMITVFCDRLGWHSLQLILSQFHKRLSFGVQPELIDLVRITTLNATSARMLYNAGYQTVIDVARAKSSDLENLLKNAVPFQSEKQQDGETNWELKERRRARCIWLTGRKGVTELDAALAIIEEAKIIVQGDLGVGDIVWGTKGNMEEEYTQDEEESLDTAIQSEISRTEESGSQNMDRMPVKNGLLCDYFKEHLESADSKSNSISITSNIDKHLAKQDNVSCEYRRGSPEGQQQLCTVDLTHKKSPSSNKSSSNTNLRESCCDLNHNRSKEKSFFGQTVVGPPMGVSPRDVSQRKSPSNNRSCNTRESCCSRNHNISKENSFSSQVVVSPLVGICSGDVTQRKSLSSNTRYVHFKKVHCSLNHSQCKNRSFFGQTVVSPPVGIRVKVNDANFGCSATQDTACPKKASQTVYNKNNVNEILLEVNGTSGDIAVQNNSNYESHFKKRSLTKPLVSAHSHCVSASTIINASNALAVTAIKNIKECSDDSPALFPATNSDDIKKGSLVDDSISFGESFDIDTQIANIINHNGQELNEKKDARRNCVNSSCKFTVVSIPECDHEMGQTSVALNNSELNVHTHNTRTLLTPDPFMDSISESPIISCEYTRQKSELSVASKDINLSLSETLFDSAEKSPTRKPSLCLGSTPKRPTAKSVHCLQFSHGNVAVLNTTVPSTAINQNHQCLPESVSQFQNTIANDIYCYQTAQEGCSERDLCSSLIAANRFERLVHLDVGMLEENANEKLDCSVADFCNAENKDNMGSQFDCFENSYERILSDDSILGGCQNISACDDSCDASCINTSLLELNNAGPQNSTPFAAVNVKKHISQLVQKANIATKCHVSKPCPESNRQSSEDIDTSKQGKKYHSKTNDLAGQGNGLEVDTFFSDSLSSSLMDKIMDECEIVSQENTELKKRDVPLKNHCVDCNTNDTVCHHNSSDKIYFDNSLSTMPSSTPRHSIEALSNNASKNDGSDCVPPTPPDKSLSNLSSFKVSILSPFKSNVFKTCNATVTPKRETPKFIGKKTSKNNFTIIRDRKITNKHSLNNVDMSKQVVSHLPEYLTTDGNPSEFNHGMILSPSNIQEKCKDLVNPPETISKVIASPVDSFESSFRDQGQPQTTDLLTQESFTIIDVCANRQLFETFLAELKSKHYYALSIACEKKPPDSQQREATEIGGKFIKKRVSTSASKYKVAVGVPIPDSDAFIVGLAISWENRDSYFVSFMPAGLISEPHSDDTLAEPCLDETLSQEERINSISAVLGLNPAASKQRVAVYDSKAAYVCLVKALGLSLPQCEDPCVCDWLREPGAKQKNLHRMVVTYCPEELTLLDAVGGVTGYSSMGSDIRSRISGRLRACTESVLTQRLMGKFHTVLADENLLTAFTDVEMPSIVTLAKMELNGFGISEAELERQKALLTEKLNLLEEQAYQMVGHVFSLTSTTDIATVLYLELKLPVNGDTTMAPRLPVHTRRNNRAPVGGTSKDVLEKLKKFHPLPAVILEWRRLSSALSKSLFPIKRCARHCSKLNMVRVYGECQIFTSTGRVSMTEPNLQNIPKDFAANVSDTVAAGGTAIPVVMRKMFIPFKGGVILTADYSQLELRIIAHLSGDSKLSTILNTKDGDVFKIIAAQIKGLDIAEVSSEHRQQAKQVCYGILYGIGPKALGEQLEMDECDADAFMETFKSRYPGIRKYLKQTVEFCHQNGYVKTMFNRRRYLPSIKHSNPHARSQAERQAVNTTIQGSAADLVKIAMTNIDKKLIDLFPDTRMCHTQFLKSQDKWKRKNCKTPSVTGAFLVLQLHDELIYEVSANQLKQVARLVQHHMESAVKLSVSLPVRMKVGPNWGELDDYYVLD